jgi:tetratricopeptide (TPR) repeat protein
LSNQGAAHYKLGDFEQASDLFIRAQEWGHDDPVAAVNIALAHLLRNEHVEARKIADDVLRLHPTNSSAATLRILAALDEEGVSNPLALLPSGFTPDAETLATAGRWYLQHDNNTEARTLLERSIELDPSSIRKRFRAGCSIEGCKDLPFRHRQAVHHLLLGRFSIHEIGCIGRCKGQSTRLCFGVQF